MANKKPSLYRKTDNKPSLYPKNPGSNRRSNNRRRSGGRNQRQSGNSDILRVLSQIFKMIPKRAVYIVGIVIVFILLVSLLGAMTSDKPKEAPTTVLIGNDTMGNVYKLGPYGNPDSNVTVAYILGVHPREKGSHRLMEEAFHSKEANLTRKYYIYKVNVTSDATDYEASRMNGQILAKEFVVPDACENNVTLAVDCHYSNGNWGVARFIYNPRENNSLANQFAHALVDKFDWLVYYTPPNPTSPEYLTGPLNDGGVASVIYEAYTEDNNNITLEHDKQMVDFIDNWNFTGS